MNRLTRRSGNGTAIYNTPSGDPVKWENNRHEVLQELADYEDTGHKPEQIMEFDMLYLEKCMEVNALHKQMQWISVKERLPENGRRVLVTFEDGFVAATEYYENGWDLWADSGDVLAWMPLPEAYHPEQGDAADEPKEWEKRMMRTFLGSRSKEENT